MFVLHAESKSGGSSLVRLDDHSRSLMSSYEFDCAVTGRVNFMRWSRDLTSDGDDGALRAPRLEIHDPGYSSLNSFTSHALRTSGGVVCWNDDAEIFFSFSMILESSKRLLLRLLLALFELSQPVDSPGSVSATMPAGWTLQIECDGNALTSGCDDCDPFCVPWSSVSPKSC